MRRSAKRKLIIILFIFILLISLLVVASIRKKYLEKKAKIDALNIPETTPSKLYTDTSIQEVETTALLLAAQDTVNKYYEYVNSNNAAGLMGVLNTEYIKSNNINSNNVISTLKTSNQNKKFFITKAYTKEVSFDHEYKYFIFGKSYTDDYKNVETEQYIANLDVHNLTFKITPMGSASEEEFNTYMDSIIHTDNGKVDVVDGNVTSIEENEYNKFSIVEGNENLKQTIENYAKYYYFLERTDTKAAYELLDDNYKNKKFGSYENFLKSSLVWKNIDIEYIKKTTENGKQVLIGVDKNGTYYIFYETSPMNYKVMLDSYTIPLEETAKKYAGASDEEKVTMCLECVREMVNLRDMQSMNKYMNTIFKDNNFSNQTTLSNYVMSKYYNNTKFEYLSYTLSGNSYIVKVKISDMDYNDDDHSYTNDYVIKLNNNLTDFEYSFNIE